MKKALFLRTLCALFVCLLFATSFQTASAQIRKPQLAGSFYPADPIALGDSLDRYFALAAKSLPTAPQPVLGIITPHAGYPFAGRAMAFAYHELAKRNIRTVIVLGPTHRQNYKGLALHSAAWWETPLGKLRVDTALEHALLKVCPFAHVIDSAFDKEQSIEDQLPFIQKALGDVQIVPVAYGTTDLSQMRAFGQLLTDIVTARKGQAVVVASSDMSHYLTSSQTARRDSVATNDVAQLDIDKLVSDIKDNRAEFCGYAPVLSLLYMSEQLSALPRFLAYTNSIYATRDTSHVVGYGSFAFYQNTLAKPLDETARKELLSIARKSVDSYARTKKLPDIHVKDSVLFQKRGAFVTLREKGQLRGCIGSVVGSDAIAKIVYEMSENACAKDKRFSPVIPEELSDIKIQISALSPLRRVRSIDQIALGTDGLLIKKGDKVGVFLPEVATENKWNREQYLDELAVKAGLPKDGWKDPEAKIFSFTAEVFGE